jgi:hypothetical protein
VDDVSWNAYLINDRGHEECEVNYTHNTNGMISAALVAAGQDPAPPCGGPLGPAIGPAWWKKLDGMSGPDGAVYLGHILAGLRGDPDRFRAMNPSNGWGDYDNLVATLQRMVNAVPNWPTVWRTSG